MTKRKAITLAIFTIWPIVSIVAYRIALSLYPTMFAQGPPLDMIPLLLFGFLSIFGTFIIIAVYENYVFDIKIVPKKKRYFWAIIIILFNGLSMPIFWYLYIWEKRTEKESPEPGHSVER